MKHKAKWAALAVLAPAYGAIAVLASAPAHANAILTLNDGGSNSIILTDAATPGMINYSGSLGSWKLTWETATIEPTLGDSPLPNMHLTAGAYGSGTLNMMLKEDDFTGMGAQEFLAGLGGFLGEGASFTGSAWLLNGSGTRIEQLANFSGPYSGAFSDAQSAIGAVDGTYGLEFDGTLKDSQIASSSFDGNVAVPEPGTLALFGAGLLACVLVGSRRRTLSPRRAITA